jgi:hypothetical protein
MGTIKALLGIGGMVAFAVASWMLIPPYFTNYQFQDEVENEARLTTYSNKSEDSIRDDIYKKAQEMDVPVEKDAIQVQRSGQQGTGSVAIRVQYTVHVDLPAYPLDLNFEASSKNKGVW